MKTAVVLFNLGGPDSPQAVEPFLFNLFRDPAIIRLPNPLRWLIAKLISRRRAPLAQHIYGQIGGKSPIREETEKQAKALEKSLAQHGEYKTFIAMRYWHPLSDETARQVKDYQPDRVLLLPLYPQFSTTTTASSLSDWHRAAEQQQLNVPTSSICCYPLEPSFIKAHVEMIKHHYQQAENPPRLLFSAHGLPKKIVDAGDPYQWQVEQAVAAVVKQLAIPDLDYVTCYQSRVGPLEWIGPATEAEITRAALEQKPVIIIPIAFVSEHSETLVELDIEYRKLAANIPYVRVPTLGTSEAFIQGLSALCTQYAGQGSICSWQKERACPRAFTGCPQKGAAADAR